MICTALEDFKKVETFSYHSLSYIYALEILVTGFDMANIAP